MPLIRFHLFLRSSSELFTHGITAGFFILPPPRSSLRQRVGLLHELIPTPFPVRGHHFFPGRTARRRTGR